MLIAHFTLAHDFGFAIYRVPALAIRLSFEFRTSPNLYKFGRKFYIEIYGFALFSCTSRNPVWSSHWHLSHSGHVVGRIIRRFNLAVRPIWAVLESSWNAASSVILQCFSSDSKCTPMLPNASSVISNDWPTNRANLKQTIKPNFKETLQELHIAVFDCRAL